MKSIIFHKHFSYLIVFSLIYSILANIEDKDYMNWINETININENFSNSINFELESIDKEDINCTKYVAYARLIFDSNYCNTKFLDLIKFNVTLVRNETKNNTNTPVQIFFYYSNNEEEVKDPNYLNYKLGNNNTLDLRTYNLSIQNSCVFIVKFYKEEENINYIIYNSDSDDSEESEHTDDSEESEHTDDSEESEHTDDSEESEHTDDSEESEHTDDSEESEHTDDSEESEHTDDSEESEHTDYSDESDHTDYSDESDHTDDSHVSDYSDDSKESDNLVDLYHIDYSDYTTIDLNSNYTNTYHLEIELISDFNDNQRINDEFEKETNENLTFYYKRDNEMALKNKKLIHTLLASNIYNFEFEYKISFYEVYNNSIINIDLDKNKHFFNGFSLVIDNNLLPKEYQNEKNEIFMIFKLKLISNYKEIIHVSSRNYSKKVLEIKEINEHYDIFLNEKNEEKCLNLSINSSHNYIIFDFISFTKNINATYSNYADNYNQIFNINKETMTFKLDYKNYNYICFIINDNDIYNYGSLSFEILEEKNENFEIIFNYSYPVIRGLWTHHYLSANTARLYKPKVYNGNNVIFNFHMTYGYSKLYIINCRKSQCNLTKEELDNKEDNIYDINGYIYNITENIANNSFALIYCPMEEQNNNTGCEFDIEIKNEDEISYLFEEMGVYSFIYENKTQEFQINIKELAKKYNDQNLIINIYSFYNLPSIKLYSNKNKTINNDPIEYYLSDNKFYYKITNENYKEYDLLNIEIEATSTIYYGIYYQLKGKNEDNNYSLEKSILFYFNDESSIDFNFINKNEKNLHYYIININSFGNNLKFNYNGNEETFNNNLLQMKLKNNDIFQIINNNQSGEYLFNLEYHENYKHNKIFVENGHSYKNRLSNINNVAVYSMFLFEIENENIIIINFRKDSYIQVNITIEAKDKNDEIIKTISEDELSKIINITKSKKYCNKEFNKYCELIVKISTNESLNSSTHLDFSIQITEYINNKNPPFYLPKNTFMNNILIPNLNQNYYTEIEKEKNGKIYIDFMEGKGRASAKIYKNITEFEGKKGTSIEFDYYNKYFDINNTHTQDCDDKCLIEINLFLEKNIQSWYKYNIYYKYKSDNTNKFNISVPETEYIYGFLDENDNNIDYYKTTITKKSKEIYFHVNCDKCILTVNGSYKEILIKDEYKYNLSLSGSNGYGEEIFYSIKNKDLNYTQRYSIKVISVENGKDLIIPINSIRNEFYKRGSCIFLISKENYNKIDKFRFLVPNDDKAKISIIDDKNQNYVKEYIKNDIYYLNAIDSKGIKYFEINVKNVTEEKYKIKVESDNDDIIIFASTIYESDELKYTYPEDYIIAYLNSCNMTISPSETNGFFYYDINLIQGEGLINKKSTNYLLEPGFIESLKISFNVEADKEDKSDIIIITENNLLFYFRIVLNNAKNNNLIELDFYKPNYCKYIDAKKTFENQPLNFFMKINTNKSNLKDINLNYKFLDDYNNGEFNASDESYNITIYLVNKNYIANQKFNNMQNENRSNIEDCISEYKEDLTAGYTFIQSSSISNIILSNDDYNKYLLIIINYKAKKEDDNKEDDNKEDDNKDINAAITTFDYSQNHILPSNQYLLMLINQERNISIGRMFEFENYPYIEYVFKNIDSNINNSYTKQTLPKELLHGKTIYKLEKNVNYNLTFENSTKVDSDLKSNLIFRYGISIFEDNSYFKFKNNSIYCKDGNQTMVFHSITGKDNSIYNINDLSIIYNIRIYQVFNDSLKMEPNIYYEKNEYEGFYLIHSIKKVMVNNAEDEISYNINFLPYGHFCLSVLAEARKGDKYEYVTYEPHYIQNISNSTNININITLEDSHFTPEYTKSVLYNATIDNFISLKDNKDYDYYIKLILKHNHSYSNNQIFVSDSSDILNINETELTELYNNSQYKVIDRETSLIIPINELLNEEIYIRIPCNGLCEYVFYYRLYTNENLTINDSECFDIDINKTVNFIYNLNKIHNTSLFTMTGYSIEEFTISKLDVEKSFFNGYSYILNHINYGNTLSFEINNKIRLKICHRFLDETETIHIGQIKYSHTNSAKECYSISKDENIGSNKYLVNLISKTKNIQITGNRDNNFTTENNCVGKETCTQVFDSSVKEICFSKIQSSEEENISFLFQLLTKSNSDNNENQPLYMPLIKGFSYKQNLEKGRILYYRIKEHSKNSKYINVNFQALSGELNVYYSHCDNYPNCIINNINDITDKKKLNIIRKNIKYNQNITEEKDIYQKSYIPIIIVNCLDGNDDCNYYIEISNDDEKILLNKNRKMYSYIEPYNNGYSLNKYKIYLSLDEISNNNKSKLYIQLYSFTGMTQLNISNYNDYDNCYHDYNNNTKTFELKLNKTHQEFDIDISESNNDSTYSLFYYIIALDSENEAFYLPSGEVHYNILPHSDNYYSYYFQDDLNTVDTNYIISINAINCALKVSRNGEQSDGDSNIEERNFQFKITKNDTIQVFCYFPNCEFTISAIEFNSNGIEELIFNDRTYQYYKFSNDFNKVTINYYISNNYYNNNINDSIYIYVDKKSNKKLSISCKDINHEVYYYNEFFNISIGENFDKVENLNIYKLTITIKEEENNNNEFKIKINGNKNNYMSYLDPNIIEYDFVQKGQEKKNNYYYEYYYKEDYKNETIEQIYLDCKGIAELSLESSESILISKETNSNYINIISEEKCKYGCKIYFSVILSNDTENNEINYYNIYLTSKSKYLNVFKNRNIYGYLINEMEYKFTTEIDDDDESLFVNFNCLGCLMYIKYSESEKEYSLDKTQKIDVSGAKRIYYTIRKTNDNKDTSFNYFYFNVLDNNTHKFIFQKESTICNEVCQFILPLYSYFKYNRDYILFYVPDTENITIYAKIINITEASYKYLNSFNLENEQYDNISTVYPMTNRLSINIDQYKNKDKYILIQVKSGLKNNYNLIVSEFLKSLEDNIFYKQNILIDYNNSLDFGSNKKLRLFLINGSGYFSIKNNEKANYSLNYENQEIILLNQQDISQVVKTSNKEKFIFYFDIEKINNDNNAYDLISQKVNYIKYINENPQKIELKFNITKIKEKDLYINYHFSELENDYKSDEDYFNCSKDSFIPYINDEECDISQLRKDKKQNLFAKYYNDIRRGYIYIDRSEISKIEGENIKFKLNQNNLYNNAYDTYKKIYLEVTPLFFDKNDKSELIEFPRNTYLEFYNDNVTNISFTKPNIIYNNITIEYAYKGNIDYNISLNDIEGKISNGKYTINLRDNNSMKYNMIITQNESQQFLLKFAAKKDNYTYFNLKNNIIEVEEEGNLTYKIKFSSIKKVNNNNNNDKYNISYLIRLYNYLDFLEDNEINNIYSEVIPINSFRKELKIEEYEKEDIEMNVTFYNITYGEFCISILGEVYYDDNVEYYAYNSKNFNYKEKKKIEFDKTWIVALVIVLVIFVIIFAFLIKFCIDSKKRKKVNDNKKNGNLLTNKLLSS